MNNKTITCLIEFKSYESCTNYIFFLFKFLFESFYVLLLCQSFYESPNIGYCKMIISAYLPIITYVINNRVDDINLESLMIAFYLYFLGIFFLMYLGRHLNEKNNIVIILNGTN